MPSYPLSDPAVQAFVVLPISLVLLLEWAVEFAWMRSGASKRQARRMGLGILAIAVAWLAGTWGVAASGLLLDFDRTPPPFAFLVVGILAIACALAFSRVGTRIAAAVPVAVLVAVQGFRLPLELAMHEMHKRGVMPVQMSYAGRNWDIVTGASAILVAVLIWRGIGGRRLMLTWNLVGLSLLVNIIVVSIASTPRFALYGPDRLNVWVMYPPFVWLPTVLVPAALAGHLVLFRALRHTRP